MSRMIFDEGYVHCDPHPGNVLVDRQQGGNTQIVLLDHGLYTQLSNKFRSGLAMGTKFAQQFCMKANTSNLDKGRTEPSTEYTKLLKAMRNVFPILIMKRDPLCQV